MAGEGRDDNALNARMADAAGELARLLDVEPSPDFTARVRRRIQDAPPRAAWGFTWEFAAAALVIVTMAVAWTARLVPGASIALPPASPPRQAMERLATPAYADVPIRRAASAAKEPQVSPEVIVDARQREALLRLLAIRGDVNQGAFPALTLDPMDVPPIEVSALEKTER